MKRKYQYEVQVQRCVDGDTFSASLVDLGMGVAYHGDIRFRLLDVDTPERGKPGFHEATEFSAQWIEGKKVLVETIKTDSFGRWLCYVYPDAESDITLNQLLLDEGLAKKYI